MEENFHVIPSKSDVTVLLTRIEKLEIQNQRLMDYIRLKLGITDGFNQVLPLENGDSIAKENEELAEEIRRLQRAFEDNRKRWDGQIQRVITAANGLQKQLCESMEKFASDINKHAIKLSESAENSGGIDGANHVQLLETVFDDLLKSVAGISMHNDQNSGEHIEHSSGIVPPPICSSSQIAPKYSALSDNKKDQNKPIPKGDEMILLLGGIETGTTNLDSILLLSGNRWNMLSVKLPKPFSGGAAVYMDEKLYIVGGSLAEKFYKLNIDTLKWTQLTSMNEIRYYITNSWVSWKGSIWIFGGSDGDKNNIKKSVERYDPILEKWFDMPDMKHARSYACVTVLNDKFIVCGGVAENDVFLKSVECFDPESGVWTELNDLPTPVAGHAVVSYGNDAILMGGNCKYANETKRTCAVLKLSALEKNEKWKEIQPMEYRRECFPAAVANDEIFIVGGVNGISLNKVEIFDGERWRNGPFLPTGRMLPGVVVIPKNLAKILYPTLETILLLGGMTSRGALDEMLLLYDGNWISLPLKLPKKFSAAGAVYLSGEVYIVGADSGKKLYKLGMDLKWIELADMHEERCYISCLTYNSEIWAFGSSNACRTIITKSVERYNPKKNEWIKMPDMHHARSDAAAAVWNDKFIVCGGWNENGCVKSVECYDPETGIWTELNDMPGPRHGHRLVHYGGNLVMLGGNDGASYHKDVLELSNLEEKGKWKKLPPMINPHHCFAAEVIHETIIVFGGSDGKLLNNTEIFDGKYWSEGPELPSGRRHAYSVVIPNDLAGILYAEYKLLQD